MLRLVELLPLVCEIVAVPAAAVPAGKADAAVEMRPTEATAMTVTPAMSRLILVCMKFFL
jgi:hypothetical protein